MISVTEANQNFSKAAKVIDEHGTAVILKNNVPRYLVIDFSKAEEEKVASNENVFTISERLINRMRKHMRFLQNDYFKQRAGDKTSCKCDSCLFYYNVQRRMRKVLVI